MSRSTSVDQGTTLTQWHYRVQEPLQCLDRGLICWHQWCTLSRKQKETWMYTCTSSIANQIERFTQSIKYLFWLDTIIQDQYSLQQQSPRDPRSWASIMSTPASNDMARTTPTLAPLLTSTSLKFDELDAITNTPKSVQGNSDTTNSIRLNISTAEGELASELKTYASASHHIVVLQANVEQGTVPKGLTPNLKLTAFKRNTALEVAVNMCLTDVSTKILWCLIAHYHEVKARSKLNALKIEHNQIEECSDQQTLSMLW